MFFEIIVYNLLFWLLYVFSGIVIGWDCLLVRRRRPKHRATVLPSSLCLFFSHTFKKIWLNKGKCCGLYLWVVETRKQISCVIAENSRGYDLLLPHFHIYCISTYLFNTFMIRADIFLMYNQLIPVWHALF